LGHSSIITIRGHAQQELPEAIDNPLTGQFLYMGEHAHGRMVLTTGTGVHAVPGERRY
jgi:hypothetical protein